MLAVLLTTALAAAAPSAAPAASATPSARTSSASAPSAPTAHAAAALRVRARFAVSGATTRVVSMRTSALPAGTIVAVECTGRGCLVARARYASEGGPMDLTGLLKPARLKSGAHLTITLAAPGAVPRATGWFIRRGKQPRRD
jgi:hypothetical protein